MSSIYNGHFLGNILVVGRTNCGKTTFIKRLGLNNFFDKIVKTEWVSGIAIDKKKEAEIQSYFKNETEVHVAQDQEKLDYLIDTFKQRSHENYGNNSNNNTVNSCFGVNRKMDQLIIIDDVSGIAKTSKIFLIFSQFQENLATIVFTFFTLLFLPVKCGRKLFLKQIFLIFFLLAFLSTRCQK